MPDELREHDLSRLTWPEVRARLDAGLRLAIIPVGSFEQHGLHLPLRTDYALAYGRALRIAALTDSVVAPVVMAGLSSHHLDFPGTLLAAAGDTGSGPARCRMLAGASWHRPHHPIERPRRQRCNHQVCGRNHEAGRPVEVLPLGVGEISAYFPPAAARTWILMPG